MRQAPILFPQKCEERKKKTPEADLCRPGGAPADSKSAYRLMGHSISVKKYRKADTSGSSCDHLVIR